MKSNLPASNPKLQRASAGQEGDSEQLAISPVDQRPLATLQRRVQQWADEASATHPLVLPKTEPVSRRPPEVRFGKEASQLEASAEKATAEASAIQRYEDVMNQDLYDNPAAIFEDPANRQLVELYAAVQRFLSDISQTKPLLDGLNAALIANEDQGLSEQLREQEAGGEADLPKLIDFVPAEDFSAMIEAGIDFEDWVDAAHGVQTHRIQWYLIRQAFPAEADTLYRQATADTWSFLDGRKMWDYVVDVTNTEGKHDFTKPERLQSYLTKTYKPDKPGLFKKRAANKLTAAIKLEGDHFDERSQALKDARPELKQEEKPEPVVAEEGTYTGWISRTEFEDLERVKVWMPTIFIPEPDAALSSSAN